MQYLLLTILLNVPFMKWKRLGDAGLQKNWNGRIDSLYYERSGLSKNKEALSALVQQQAVQLQPANVINTPLTLEFLG